MAVRDLNLAVGCRVWGMRGRVGYYGWERTKMSECRGQTGSRRQEEQTISAGHTRHGAPVVTLLEVLKPFTAASLTEDGPPAVDLPSGQRPPLGPSGQPQQDPGAVLSNSEQPGSLVFHTYLASQERETVAGHGDQVTGATSAHGLLAWMPGPPSPVPLHSCSDPSFGPSPHGWNH